jgi:hypothetical protein
MKEVGEDKIAESKEDIEIESEEKARGEKIEVDEDRLLRAMAIHGTYTPGWRKRDGARCHGPLLVSHRCGTVNGRVTARKRDISCSTEGVPGGFYWRTSAIPSALLLSSWPASSCLPENTVTAVLPVMQNPTLGNFGLLLRLWGVVLLGNIIGTGIAAWAFEYMPIFDEPTRDAFVKIGMDVMKNTPAEMFANAIISGWIIATMVWMFLPQAAPLW